MRFLLFLFVSFFYYRNFITFHDRQISIRVHIQTTNSPVLLATYEFGMLKF